MLLTKKEARQKIIESLIKVKPAEKQQAENSLYCQLFQTRMWHDAAVVAVTVSQAIEINTEPIIKQAHRENKVVCIPRTLPSWQMEFVELNAQTTLKKTDHQLLEPVGGNVFSADEINLIVVPGVSYTTDGYRLGFGGGYYDRYLASYAGDTISLALPEQQNTEINWPIKQYDIKIKQILVAAEED